MKTFGEYVRLLRLTRRLTLREFCRIASLDPSNWSKIERNLHQPPKGREILVSVAEALEVKEGSEEWNSLFDLAIVGHIPVGLAESQAVIDKLPIFFRTVRGQKPTREELEKLVELLGDY